MEIPCPLQLGSQGSPEVTATEYAGVSTSFAELERKVCSYQRGLRRESIVAGDVVALLSPTTPDLLALLFACMREGLRVLPLHLRLTERDWQQQLKQVEAKVLISEEDFPQLEIRTISFTQLRESSGAEVEDAGEVVQLRPEAVFALLFTSGSSGHAKCVELSLENFLYSASCSNKVTELQLGDTWLLSLPLYHVAGLGIAFRGLLARASVQIPSTPDLAGVRSAVLSNTLTHLSLVPSMLEQLLDEPKTREALKLLKCIMLGGAAIPERLARRVLEEEIPAFSSYGMSETCSHVTLSRINFDSKAFGGSGRALPGMEVEIQDELGKALPTGEQGEIAIKSKSVFPSYLNANPAKRIRNAWFLSNDLGYLNEEGELFVIGRQEEMIISGGENIHLAEIRRCAEDSPEVKECAVVGVAHPRWGQRPVLLYSAVEEASAVSSQSLEQFLSEKLPKIKRPERVIRLVNLPKTAIGKLDLQRLKAIAEEKRGE